MDPLGVFTVDYGTKTDFYSAYKAYDVSYINNRFLNPFYGYKYSLADTTSLTESPVVFTNNLTEIQMTPNVTKNTYFGSGYDVTDQIGNYFWYPPKNSEELSSYTTLDDFEYSVMDTDYDWISKP